MVINCCKVLPSSVSSVLKYFFLLVDSSLECASLLGKLPEKTVY